MTVTWSTDAEQAPKGVVILADFGMPSTVSVIWNPISKEWCCAELKTDLFDGKWNDHYFENEHYSSKYMRGWCLMPTLPDELVGAK